MKYIKLFENFNEDEFPQNNDDMNSPDGTKKWMSDISEINVKVKELRETMDMIQEARRQVEELQKNLGVSDLMSKQEMLLEDIKVGMGAMNKSMHKAFGLILKHRKGTLRWDPPSKTLMLEIIEMSVEGAKEFIAKLKSEAEFKTPVKVSPSLKVEYDKEGLEEAEMTTEKPWYSKAWDKFTNWLSSFRRRVIDVSEKLDNLVEEFEETLTLAEMREEAPNDDMEKQREYRRPMY